MESVSTPGPVPGHDPLARLSPRERQLLGLMAEGHSNAAISQALWLSPKTVESHVRSIFAKLGLDAEGHHRRVSAVLLYLDSERRRGRLAA